MQAITYEGPTSLTLVQRTPRALEAGEVRLAVDSVGVCGTDVRIYKGEHGAYGEATGRIPGHEIVGRVVESATRADKVPQHQPVFVAPNLGCGSCRQCTEGHENLCDATDGVGITIDGGFAQELIVPARAVGAGNLIPLDAGVDLDAAVLIEPLACVLRGQDRIAVGANDHVLVAGGGPVGLLHVALAASRGAAQVICSEPSGPRRDAARRAGATHTVDPTTEDLAEVIAAVTSRRGVDVVITAAPVHRLQTDAVHQAAKRGRILYFGGLPKSSPTVELDTNQIHYKELLIAGTTASSLADCRAAAELVSTRRLDVGWMVSDRLPLDAIDSAIERVQDGRSLKVVLKPQHVKETA